MASDEAITNKGDAGALAVVDEKQTGGHRQELSVTERHVLKLQIESGMEFALFPKLPLEIQRMVWRHSAHIPQVVGIKQVWIKMKASECVAQHVPVTAHSQQRFACREREARREAMKILLPVEVRPEFKKGDEIDMPRIFFNPFTDTLWLTAMGNAEGQLANMRNWYRFPDKSQQEFNVPKLALPATIWLEKLRPNPIRLMRILSNLKVEEVIAVVAGEAVDKSIHVKFIEPIVLPQDILAAPSQYMSIADATTDATVTWNQVQEADMKTIRNQQAKQAAERKAYSEQLALTGIMGYEPEDASDWTVKRVRYMQATSFNKSPLH